MDRRKSTSLAANPVLIGAVTTLIVVVAVFLSYNANSGLPFVPTYDLDVVVPDAAELVPGNEVRIGGSRVGVVKEIEAVPGTGDGPPAARLSVALERASSPLAADTRATVRQRSNLGLKYLELVPGRSDRGLEPGGEIPLKQATGVVAFDDAISAFDEPTRRGVQTVVRELGGGLAGRGADLNDAIGALPDVAGDLRAVAANLRADGTDLRGFLEGARATAAALEPVTPQLGSLLEAGARTFEALGAEDAAIDRTLVMAPATLRNAGAAFRDARPLFAETAGLLRDARPAIDVLGRSSDRLTAGLNATTPILRRTPRLGTDLGRTLTRLDALTRRASLPIALRHLTTTVRSLGSALEVIVPFQTRCNYLGLWGRNVPGVISEGDAMGTWFRFIPIVQGEEMLQGARASSSLHAMPVADTGAGGECEPGNDTFLPGQQIGPAPGVQPGATEQTSPPVFVEGAGR
ncbi:MCE family protein [Conexibacter sp. W3-3-2]|uniref:MlaD family protein n=1 Tax=Conexibacter sp. W3-3-2 TaxID=2675227 RepID=UPI0012B85C57|nr:MlaD family protein [Conexibacter sp. W3-3-2]MTD43756.1 MCE family protein [Conexibacter sp. W3-3-2]